MSAWEEIDNTPENLRLNYRVNEWIFPVWEDRPVFHAKVNAAASMLTWQMTVEHFRRMAEMHVASTEPGTFEIRTEVDPSGALIVIAYVLDSAQRLWYVAELSS